MKRYWFLLNVGRKQSRAILLGLIPTQVQLQKTSHFQWYEVESLKEGFLCKNCYHRLMSDHIEKVCEYDKSATGRNTICAKFVPI
jgi:hypothetical protein